MSDRDYDLTDVLTTYRLDGSMIRGKAKALVEVWLDLLYPRLQDPELPTATLLDAGKVLMKLGDLEPKLGGMGVPGGGGFSISINIPSPDGGAGITITGRSDMSEEQPVLLDITDFSPLPARPSHIPVPDFGVNGVLSAGMVEFASPTTPGLPASAPPDHRIAPPTTGSAPVGAPDPLNPGTNGVVSRPFSVPIEMPPVRLANPATPA